MIRQYLSDIIIKVKFEGTDHKIQVEWKIQLTIETNFVSSKNSNETRTMITKSVT